MQKPPGATSDHRETLSGLIERVTFFNEETGFAVLRVKVKGDRELVTVVGSLPSVGPGEWLTAEGTWVHDKTHGLQLRADILKSAGPSTREGIEKYLGSGMVKGVGPACARNLVEKFGEKVFDIIENFSKRLEEVEGIGPERRRRIKEAWTEQKFIREIMVFLHSHGVSTSRAVRIYKTYGEGAMERVRTNPYDLARDIHGIGFKTADQIAERLGIGHDSVLRAEAGLAHTLWEAAEQGHCALPLEMLLQRTALLLRVEEKTVREAFTRLAVQGELVEETFGERALVFLPKLREAEMRVASRLRQRVAEPARYPVIDFDKAVAWCERNTGATLAAQQREALRLATRERLVIVTGGPGVGKTTLINSILKVLSAKQVNCALCAPTGRAAKRMAEATGRPAQTIHRLLRFDRAEENLDGEDTHPLRADLLIIDEFSMVDLLLFDRLLRGLSDDTNLLLVGDVDQLPSIGPGSVLRDIIRSGVCAVVHLTEVFRQAAQSRITRAAHAVNGGEFPELPGPGEDSDFYFIERESPEHTAHTLLELVHRRIPRKLGCDARRDIQVLCPMNRGSLGVQKMNLRLQAALNPVRPGEPVVARFGSEFRLRDKIIQTENDYSKEVFNGDIGEIIGIDSTECSVRIRFERREVRYDFAELDEVSLAYAITIHKAQGSEFPAVVIPLAMQQYLLLQRNLIYTGITRGRKMVVLIGEKAALRRAVQNAKTRQRFSGLLTRLQGNAATLIEGSS